MHRLVVGLLVAAALGQAQTPAVGVIEIYGLRKVKVEAVRKALGVVEGDKLPASRMDAEERIEGLEGVVRASLTAVCCTNGKAILYVGVEEKGGAHFEFHTPPAMEVKVPTEVENAWVDFIVAVEASAKRGNAEEDLTKGHSLMRDANARRIQEQFIGFAEQHLDMLRLVLKNAADEQQRAIAAYVLGYSPKKKIVANDLQYAMQDSDPTVRNNAMRALSAILVLAELDPTADIKIAPTWFVEMLNSIHFTDRSKAAATLVNFTEKRDEGVLRQIREQGMTSLREMAQWQELGHALPAFILLGRVAGIPEEQIQELWKEGKRDELLKRVKEVAAPAKKK